TSRLPRLPGDARDTLRRRPATSCPANAIRARRLRRAEPLWLPATREARRAPRGGIHAYPSTLRPRGEARADGRCLVPAERAAPPPVRVLRGHSRPRWACGR